MADKEVAVKRTAVEFYPDIPLAGLLTEEAKALKENNPQAHEAYRSLEKDKAKEAKAKEDASAPSHASVRADKAGKAPQAPQADTTDTATATAASAASPPDGGTK